MSDIVMGDRKGLLKEQKNQYEVQKLKEFAAMAESGKVSYADFIKSCIDADKQNHRMSRNNYRLKCFKNDGIYQLNRAITDVFGAVVSCEEDKGPSAGEQSINMVDVQLADGTRVKVPYGEIALDTLGEGSKITINYNNDTHELIIEVKCQQMHMPIMDKIADLTIKYLANESIYKGQGIEITDINNPVIMDLSNIDKQLMILSKKTKYDLGPIYARILTPEKCLQKGIPLKYGTLLEGSYGSGKTLAAFKIAKLAVEHGWMFVYLKEPSLLAEALRMAKIVDKSGHGVVLFLEDVDQVVRGDRDAAMQDILNTLDGGDTKDMNVIFICTTNHIELIEPTFLRGKRIGSIISFGALDAETAEEFIRTSFSSSEGYVINDDLKEVCQFIEDSNIVPAFMAEIIEAIKSRMLLDEEVEVKAEYLKFQVESYKHQVELSKKKDMSKTPEKLLAENLQTIISNKVGEFIDKSTAELKEYISENC